MHWSDFNIEHHALCGYDYMKIYNGPTFDSPVVGTYCGTTKPDDFTSGSELITILFESDFSQPGVGWKLDYEVDAIGMFKLFYFKS